MENKENLFFLNKQNIHSCYLARYTRVIWRATLEWFGALHSSDLARYTRHSSGLVGLLM